MFTDTAASKVTAAHLANPALLYVRQSTLKQVIHHTSPRTANTIYAPGRSRWAGPTSRSP